MKHEMRGAGIAAPAAWRRLAALGALLSLLAAGCAYDGSEAARQMEPRFPRGHGSDGR